MSDFDKTKKILEDEYEYNNLRINELDEKIRLLRINSFSNKGQLAIALGLLPWVGLCFATPYFASKGIPVELLSLSNVLIPAGIGFGGVDAIQKHNGIPAALKEFSSATTEEEMFREKIKYEIEKAFLMKQNEVLERVYHTIDTEEQLLKSLSKNYDVRKKMVDANYCVDRLDELNSLFEKKMEELRVLSIQNYLKETFFKVRYRFFGNGDSLVYSMMGFLAGMASVSLPMILVALSGGEPASNVGFMLMSGAAIGTSTCTIVYNVLKNKVHTSTFLDENKTLGNNRLDEVIKNDKQRNEEQAIICKNLDDVIQMLVNIRIQIEEEKRRRESDKTVSIPGDDFEKVIDYEYGVEDKVVMDTTPDRSIDTGKKLTKTYQPREECK